MPPHLLSPTKSDSRPEGQVLPRLPLVEIWGTELKKKELHFDEQTKICLRDVLEDVEKRYSSKAINKYQTNSRE